MCSWPSAPPSWSIRPPARCRWRNRPAPGWSSSTPSRPPATAWPTRSSGGRSARSCRGCAATFHQGLSSARPGPDPSCDYRVGPIGLRRECSQDAVVCSTLATLLKRTLDMDKLANTQLAAAQMNQRGQTLRSQVARREFVRRRLLNTLLSAGRNGQAVCRQPLQPADATSADESPSGGQPVVNSCEQPSSV